MAFLCILLILYLLSMLCQLEMLCRVLYFESQVIPTIAICSMCWPVILLILPVAALLDQICGGTPFFDPIEDLIACGTLFWMIMNLYAAVGIGCMLDEDNDDFFEMSSFPTENSLF